MLVNEMNVYNHTYGSSLCTASSSLHLVSPYHFLGQSVSLGTVRIVRAVRLDCPETSCTPHRAYTHFHFHYASHSWFVPRAASQQATMSLATHAVSLVSTPHILILFEHLYTHTLLYTFLHPTHEDIPKPQLNQLINLYTHVACYH